MLFCFGNIWHTIHIAYDAGTIMVGCQKHNLAVIFLYHPHKVLPRRYTQPLDSIILLFLFFQELLIVLPLSTFRFLQIFEYKQNSNSLTISLSVF